jgi:hypothetical protein
VLEVFEAPKEGSAMVNVWLTCAATVEVVLVELGWFHCIIQVDGQVILDHCPQREALGLHSLFCSAAKIVCQWLPAKV